MGLLLAVLTVTIMAFGGAYSFVWVGSDLCLFAITLVLLWTRARRNALPAHPALVPMGIFGGLALLQWGMHRSVYPAATLTGIIQLTGCACSFYLAYVLLHELEHVRYFGFWAWGFTGVLSGEAIVQYFTGNGKIYWYHDASYATPVGPYVYHNHFAGCLEMILPLAFAVAFRSTRHRDGQQWFDWTRRGLIPAVGMAALVVSQSRGGIIVFAFECLLGAFIFFPEIRRSGRTVWGAILGIGSLLSSFAFLANWQTLVFRFTKLASHDVSAIDRWRVAQSCLHIFRDHPWIGTGFDTFSVVYPRYQSFDNGLVWMNAHNEYAQALAEMGIIGVIAWLAFIAILVTLLLRARKQISARLSSRVHRAVFISVCGLLIHSAGDFQFHSPANALLFFAMAGACCAPLKMLHRGTGPRVSTLAVQQLMPGPRKI